MVFHIYLGNFWQFSLTYCGWRLCTSCRMSELPVVMILTVDELTVSVSGVKLGSKQLRQTMLLEKKTKPFRIQLSGAKQDTILMIKSLWVKWG